MDENKNRGFDNTGYCNTGSDNTGSFNTGRCNTSNCNKGNYNTSYCNLGNKNTGHSNIGCRNTGNYNRGHLNVGHWNISDGNVGCFNTIEPKITLFNKPTDITLNEWEYSRAYGILDCMPTHLNWICQEDMTEEEKEEHPEYYGQGGYLRELNQEELYTQRQKWYNNLTDDRKKVILSIPNFDADIFKECTGIDVKRTCSEQ